MNDHDTQYCGLFEGTLLCPAASWCHDFVILVNHFLYLFPLITKVFTFLIMFLLILINAKFPNIYDALFKPN